MATKNSGQFTGEEPRCRNGHANCPGGCTAWKGRDTKWTPELNDEIVDFFGTEERSEDRLASRITKPNGETLDKFERFPKPLPFIHRFELDHGLAVGLLSRWAAEQEALVADGKPETKPGFLQAYKLAKEMQKEFLVQNGLSGLYNATAFIFTAKNITDMRDRTEQEVSGPGGTPLRINVTTYGTNDPLSTQLAAGAAPAARPDGSGALQDDRVAPQGPQDDAGDQ